MITLSMLVSNPDYGIWGVFGTYALAGFIVWVLMRNNQKKVKKEKDD